MDERPLAVDLFCGKGGWTDGLLAAGWRVVGFDILRYPGYRGELVIQDVATIDGRPMRGRVGLIVASPPCTEYSYMAMPWTLAKQKARWYRAEDLDSPLSEIRRPVAEARQEKLNALFNHCLRIAAEAECPIVIENVKGAQPWIGKARAHFGSFYLWGGVDSVGGRIVVGRLRFGQTVKAGKRLKKIGDRNSPGEGLDFAGGKINADPLDTHEYKNESVKVAGLNWGNYGKEGYVAKGFNVTAAQRYREGLKQGNWWHDPESMTRMTRKFSSRSDSRKEASAEIARIPFALARYIGEQFINGA